MYTILCSAMSDNFANICLTLFYFNFASKCCDIESLSGVCSRWHLDFISNGPALVRVGEVSIEWFLEPDEVFFTVTWKVNIEFPMQICRQRADTRHGNEKIWCESSLIISTSWTETRERGERGNDRPPVRKEAWTVDTVDTPPGPRDGVMCNEMRGKLSGASHTNLLSSELCTVYFKLMINHSSGKCVERKLWIRIENVDWEAIVWHALINFHSHSLNSKQRVLETRDWSEECDTSVQWTEITTGFHSPDPLTVNSLNTVLVRLTEPVPGPQAPRGQC